MKNKEELLAIREILSSVENNALFRKSGEYFIETMASLMEVPIIQFPELLEENIVVEKPLDDVSQSRH